VFVSKKIPEDTDDKIKRLVSEMEERGQQRSESELMDEAVDRLAEDMGVEEVFEEEKDDFMDIFE